MKTLWTARIEQYIAEGRTVSGGKGDSTVKAGETQQLQFNQQLQNMFATQFGKKSGVLDYLNGKMTGMIDNPQGYSPDALAAMRTQASEGTARSFAQASQATHQMEAARGGSTLPSGVNAQIDAENATGAAAAGSAAQNQITQADANLKQQNYWNAVNVLGGTAAQYNPEALAGEANGGSGALAGLGNTYANSQQTGFFNTLANGFAASIGKTLGGGNQQSGGASSVSSFF